MVRGVSLSDMAHDAGVAILAYSISDKYITVSKLGHHYNLPIDLKSKLEIHDLGGTSVLGIKYEHMPI